MDKQENNIMSYNHSIQLLERKNLVISGVKKIDNFDSKQFIIETIMGFLIIKGEGLELLKLDTIQGNISIKGHLCSMTYADESSKKDDNVLSRLFK